MFKVQNTILSDDIATAKFACDVARCKGACCVVGDAGAPVSEDELPRLKEAFHLLKDELRPQAVEKVKSSGLIQQRDEGGYSLNCTDEGACIFAQYLNDGTAVCAIQKAFYEGRINWEKPLSCHLFPLRLKRAGNFDYANFDYVPSTCSAGCEKGKQDDIYLADVLEKPLVRRYGRQWYDEFREACRAVRDNTKEETTHA